MHLVSSFLEGRNPAADESGGQVVSGQALLLQRPQATLHQRHLFGVAGGVALPIRHRCRRRHDERREPQGVVSAFRALDVEEGLVPPLGGLHAEDLGEVGAGFWDNGAGTNLRHQLLRCRHVRIRHRLLSEAKEAEEQFQCRVEAKVGFAESNEARKGHDCIGCEVMRLELKM